MEWRRGRLLARPRASIPGHASPFTDHLLGWPRSDAPAQGYTQDDLEPIVSRMLSLDRNQAAAFWLGDRAGFRQTASARGQRLDSDLRARHMQQRLQGLGGSI